MEMAEGIRKRKRKVKMEKKQIGDENVSLG